MLSKPFVFPRIWFSPPSLQSVVRTLPGILGTLGAAKRAARLTWSLTLALCTWRAVCRTGSRTIRHQPRCLSILDVELLNVQLSVKTCSFLCVAAVLDCYMLKIKLNVSALLLTVSVIWREFGGVRVGAKSRGGQWARKKMRKLDKGYVPVDHCTHEMMSNSCWYMQAQCYTP